MANSRLVVRQCTVCLEEFEQITSIGHPFMRCPKHREKKYRDKRTIIREKKREQEEQAASAPGEFAEIRRCAWPTCNQEFVAQDPRQLYCNVNCYAEHRCHYGGCIGGNKH